MKIYTVINKNNKVYLSLLFLLLLYGCKVNDVHFTIKECVKSKTDKEFVDLYNDYNMDVYKMVNSIEQEFLEMEILENLGKDEYIRLISLVKNYNSDVLDNKLVNKYSPICGFIAYDVLSTCNYEIIIKEKNELNSTVVNQYKSGQKLLETGHNLDELIEFVQLTDSSDFKRIEYRTPALVSLLFRIDLNKYPTNRNIQLPED